VGNKDNSQSKTSGTTSARKTAQRGLSEARSIPTGIPAAGNQAIGRLLQAAAGDAGIPLDQSVRGPLEHQVGANLGNVRVHEGRSAEAAADSVGARAYTIGSDIYLGAEAHGLSAEARQKLLTHEAVHTVQQGGTHVPLTGSMTVSSPNDAAEREARKLAEGSPALAMRNAMRVTPVAPGVQRDIGPNWTKEFALGKMEIHFKKTEATVPGGAAQEDGDIKFTPDERAPESNSIRFIQIARTFDTTTGKDFDWKGTPEANRNKLRTAQDTKANVTGGFFIDQIHAGRVPRAKKADAPVLPFYDVTSPGTIGKKKGKTIVPTTLHDTPNFHAPLKFNLVTVAKAQDTGVVYGVVLWGFETFLDKTGVAKIKNEYHIFRRFQGETFDAALQKFNEFYKNPGTPGAPTT
jgi:hypothetical protein